MTQRLCQFVLAILVPFSACDANAPGTMPTPECPKNVRTIPSGYAPVSLKPGATLDTYGDCSSEHLECPAKSDCKVVFLDTGSVGPCCVGDSVWTSLSCNMGGLAELDSAIGQMVCEGIH